MRALARVLAELADKFGGHQIDDAVVPIFTPQAHVPFDGQRLEAARRQPHQRHVKRSATEVVHQNGLLLDGQRRLAFSGRSAGLKRISQGGRGRLIENVQDVETRDAAGILGRLAARVVEVRRHGDHGLANRADAALGVMNELTENQRRQGLRAKFSTRNDLSINGMAHVALDDRGHFFGLLQGHVARRLTDHHARFVDEHRAGRQHVAFDVGHSDGVAALIQHGDGAKSSPEVDADQVAGMRRHDGIVARAERVMKRTTKGTCGTALPSRPSRDGSGEPSHTSR